MKCKERIPGEPRCKGEATIKVPTGYGRDDLMCERHARLWAGSHLRWFNRMTSFYAVLDVQQQELGAS